MRFSSYTCLPIIDPFGQQLHEHRSLILPHWQCSKGIGYYSNRSDDLGALSFISSATKQSMGLVRSAGWGDKMVAEIVDFMAQVFAKKWSGKVPTPARLAQGEK